MSPRPAQPGHLHGLSCELSPREALTRFADLMPDGGSGWASGPILLPIAVIDRRPCTREGEVSDGDLDAFWELDCSSQAGHLAWIRTSPTIGTAVILSDEPLAGQGLDVGLDYQDQLDSQLLLWGTTEVERSDGWVTRAEDQVGPQTLYARSSAPGQVLTLMVREYIVRDPVSGTAAVAAERHCGISTRRSIDGRR